MGTKETLGPQSIQFMTAGTGVRHSEANLEDANLRFIQTWITPRKHGLKPNYGSFSGEKADLDDAWVHLVSDVEDSTHDTPVKINQVQSLPLSLISPCSLFSPRVASSLLREYITTGDLCYFVTRCKHCHYPFSSLITASLRV